MRRALVSTLTLCLVLAAAPGARAERAFTQRFSTNAQGGITIAANGIESCVGSEFICPSVRAGTAPANQSNNNQRLMTYVDVDGDPTTFDSSEATLNVPEGARVLFAGLYYGGRLAAGTGGAPAPSPAAANTVLFQGPGADTYATLTASIPLDTAGQTYQGFVDVTSRVAAAGSGVYRVANVQAGTGRSDGQLAGWSLVVAYADPTAPTRNLSVFDGLQNVGSASAGVAIDLSGFRTPLSGPVNSSVGIVAYEGDLGTTGDGAGIRNGTGGFTPLGNAANPANNLFNSSISINGVNTADRFPDYVNNLGFDANIFALPNVLGNGQTSTQVRLTTSGDAYQPGVVTIATDLFAPRIDVPKTVSADVADVGQVLTYTIPVRNTGEDAATGVVLSDVIPEDTAYVPGSLGIDGTLQSDAAGDDLGEVAGGRVVARLGSGATAAAGGRLAPSSPTSTVTFQVRVNTTVPAEKVIANVARVDFAAETTDDASSVQSAPAETRVRAPAVDLAVDKTVLTEPTVPFGYFPGETIRYRVTVTNDGTLPAPDTVLTDPLPSPLVAQGDATTSQGSCTGTTCALGTVAPGATVTVELAADFPGLEAFPSDTAVTNTATATSGGVETNPDNNTATAEIETSPAADTFVEKTVTTAEPLAGGPVTYTIVVGNDGPDVVDVNFAELLPDELLSPQIVLDPTTGTGECSIGEFPELPGVPVGLCVIPQMEVGGRRTITLTGTLARDSAGRSIVNRAVDSPDAIETDGYANNADEATIVPRRVDLAFTKTRLESGPVAVGGETTFRLSATNNGDGTARGVVLRDDLPAGLTPLGPPAGCAVSGQAVACAVDAIAPGATASFDVRARAEATVAGQTLTNRGSVVSVSPDLDSSNDAAAVQVPIGPAPPAPPATNDDLAIRVLAPNGPARVGQATRWRLEVTNAGPVTATGVNATATPSGGTILPGTRATQAESSALGTLAPGARRTIAVAVRPTRRGTLTLTGAVRGNEPETRSDNNRDQGSVRVKRGRTALALTTTPSVRSVRGGKTLRLTLRVRNTGRHTARGVTVCQRLPGVLRPTRPAGARLRNGVPCWALPPLAAGGSRRLVLTVRAARVTRVARVTATVRAENASRRRASARVRITSPRRAPRFTG